MVKKYSLALLFLFSLSFSSAFIDVSIDVSESFSEGENIFYNYYLSSAIDAEVEYVASVFCGEDVLQSVLTIENVSLRAGEVFTSEFNYGNVGDFVNEVDCKAKVSIFSPITAEFEEGFKIISEKIFVVNLRSCEDLECLRKRVTFKVGDNVYLDAKAILSDVEFSGVKLNYPSGKNEVVSLPYNFIISEIGSYKLVGIVSKEGYRDVMLDHDFFAIAIDDEIGEKNFSDYPVAGAPDEKVSRDSGENVFTSLGSAKEGLGNGWLIVLVVVAVLVAIFIIVFFMNRREVY